MIPRFIIGHVIISLWRWQEGHPRGCMAIRWIVLVLYLLAVALACRGIFLAMS